ncbi:MAG: GNAT family N-acetyltransferase [Anaerolineaceae bacterium]|nr:GNAT family N-acetyltransferase [Anaerolineaceae bacterium]
MCFEIRPSKLSDIGAAYQLDQISFEVDAWTMLDYAGVFSFPGVKKFTAIVDAKLVGFAAAEYDPQRKAVCLMTLAVDPQYRKKGIGFALLKQCEDAFPQKHFYLNVDIENQAAIRLYEKAGYQRTGIEPAYYRNGHDALIMEK